MQCKNCGGKLHYQNGFFLCENCNNRYDLTSTDEYIDVFIAYIENDKQNRRTRDSIIAQDLFHKFENAKISAFYQRVSAENLTESDFENVLKKCAAQAKILLFVGTNRDNFEKLIIYYHDFSSKKIIPVYSGMNANDLPSKINKLQSLNYDAVGAAADIERRVLQLLGREEEITFLEAVYKHKNKKKQILFISLISVLIILVGISAYVVFGTTLVLPGKKYEAAQTLIMNEKYADAINILSDIADYKDCSDLLKGIYDRYEGYYQTKDNSIGLHLIISDDSVISVEINEKSDNNAIVKITENAEINKNTATVSFNDSINQQGTAIIELTNEGINLNIQREQAENKTIFFQLNEKSDIPISEEITAETIKDWLLNGITESDLMAKGYEIAFERPVYRAIEMAIYKIKNTDIRIALYPLGISETEHLSGIKYFFDNQPDNDRVVMGVSAPAEILAPEKVGKSSAPFVEDDILYVPGGEFDYIGLYITDSTPVINSDTIIGCTSKILMGEEYWNDSLEEYNIY